MSILLSALIGGVIGYFIGSIIDASIVRKQLKEDQAFYGDVVRIQPKSMTIKEIDEDGDYLQHRRLESEEGVSDDLYVGERIYA